MPALDRIWTREEVLALPDDGNRYEFADGVLLVSPTPRRLHQRAVFELAKVLDRYVAGSGIGTTELSPAELDDARIVEVWTPDDDRPAILAAIAEA